ncbi:MAG: glycosyltransferase family 4 protein [Ramlibacter sp.]|nr:glycosyltransferase family 4 protein [Ramlibacter sp.]
MRIAITADPELPVPPLLYGGIERVIDMLVRGLVQRGHSVTLFAHGDSKVPCELVSYRGQSSGSRADTFANMLDISRRVTGGDFDVVHSFGRIAYLLPLLPLTIPKLMTYQREITPRSVRWGHRLSRGTLHFSAISNWMMDHVKDTGNWHLVYNGVPMHVYDFVPSVAPEAPLVFLGRIEQIKGTHLAVKIALQSGRRLVIAGNIPPGHETYFEQLIRPHIDGRQITYVGPVDDRQKNILLGSAAAFLMPILWEEPFGIVMAEALACGTPVLGLRRGAVPEVVEHGVSGFVADDMDDLVSAVRMLPTLDRRACRARAQELFSDDAIVTAYESLYTRLMQPS